MKTWIVPTERRHPTPNIYDSAKAEDHRHIVDLEAVILHYTADDFGPSLNTFLNPAAMASAHFLVDRDGTSWQLAALEDRTWHAGGKTSTLHGMRDVNARTIGIEIVNDGLLHREGLGAQWKSWRGLIVPDEKVLPDPKDPFHKAWETYPQVQMDAVIGLLRQLVLFVPRIKINPSYWILGHQDVDPTRKVDPGKAFDWNLVRKGVVAADWIPTPKTVSTEKAEPVSEAEPKPPPESSPVSVRIIKGKPKSEI